MNSIDIRLSENFYLSEFTRSQTAARKGINNSPNTGTINNLKILVTEFLQPLRDYIDSPIVITSGYRSPTLNEVIGGSLNSQHCVGQAVDFVIPELSLPEIVDIVRKRFIYDQLILEYNSWIHASYRKTGNRKQYLIIS